MSNLSLVLGIHTGHDASAALLKDGRITAVIAEERLSRKKHQRGFPTLAIREVLRIGGVEPKEVGVIALQGRNPGTMMEGLSVASPDEPPTPSQPSLLRQLRRKMGNAMGYSLNWPRLFLESGLVPQKMFYVEHHLCHAAGAYYTSGFDKALCVTVDGFGDQLSATVGLGEGENLSRSYTVSDRNSIGSFYQAITEALGFEPIEGENKTMGLACYGDPDRFYDELKRWIWCDDAGRLQTKEPWQYRRIQLHGDTGTGIVQADEFRKLVGDEQKRRDLAAACQRVVEEVLAKFFRKARENCGSSLPICVAGGVMLNVKFNKLVHEQLGVRDYYVFPDAGDSGLALGAALYAQRLQAGRARVGRLRSVYLGNEFDAATIEAELRRHQGKIAFSRPARYYDAVADLLIGGVVLGWFQGRMEMGPRALGARSVLADPRNQGMKDKINKYLKKRDWFVPFAPSGLDAKWDTYLEGYIPEYFMTKAFNVRPEYRAKLPAITHVDGTARPQGVLADTNPAYYQLLETMERKIGFPVVLNTSFNRHGLPIVGSPKDAVEHLLEGNVEGLAIGPFLAVKAEDAAKLPAETPL